MEARDIIQFLLDEIKDQQEKNYSTYTIRVEGGHGIAINKEDVEKLQKLINIADFVEQITKDVMKQFLFNLRKEDLK